jgi:hypothetical protein
MTVCTTDAVAARLEDLQEVLGEGPGWEAARTLTLIESDLVEASEWPSFSAQAVREVGALTMYCVPMRPRSHFIGVLTLHVATDRAGAADPAVIQFLADTVGAALLRDHPGDQFEVEGPWALRAKVHQATGMIAAQLQLDAEDGMAVLRAHAFAHETSIDHVAEDLVERRLTFGLRANEDRPEEKP